MSNVIKQIKKKNAELQALVKEASKQSVLKEFFVEAFKALPKEVEAIRWFQYTPHFNDGDACVFSVHEPLIKLVGAEEDEDGDYRDGFQDVWSLRYEKKIPTGVEKVVNKLYADMQELEDVLLAAFDDGYQITITRNGDIEVEEYSHD